MNDLSNPILKIRKTYLIICLILLFFNVANSQNEDYELPYSEGFEKNTFEWTTFPDGWKRVKYAKDSLDSSIVAEDGEYFLSLQVKGNINCQLVSPLFSCLEGVSSQFSFSYSTVSIDNLKISLLVQTNGDSWEKVWSKSVINTAWQEQSVNLSQFAGQSFRLKIEITGYSESESFICFDNIGLLSSFSKVGRDTLLSDKSTALITDKTLLSPISSRGYSLGAGLNNMQLKSTSISPDTGVDIFNSGNYDVYQYTITGETTEILNARRSQYNYSIFQVNAPETNPNESTLALMNELGTSGAEFMDLYNMSYSGASQFGIRLQKRGAGVLKPFVIDFFDGTTNTRVFQTESSKYSTFYGGLGLEGSFFSIKSNGDGYTYSGIELESSESTTSKLWQIVHKQDIPNALSFNFHNGTSWTFPLLILANGHILAGTFSDSGDKINVNGAINATGYKVDGSLLNVNHLSSGDAQADQVPVADGAGGIAWQRLSGGGETSVWTSNSGTISYNDGDVSIGTNAIPHNLYVPGKIYASEVKVLASVPVPDYVFEKSYQLTTLDELENYLEENKHLPGIPSGKEIETDGFSLSEMNLLLLKKVEELTLYVINQQKEIEELKKKCNK
nr:choice-of-anchor J domain-containing protein [uncultured Draconibacterium sp.]